MLLSTKNDLDSDIINPRSNPWVTSPTLKTPQERTTLQRQIEATDKQIDQLVYQLYGLTDDEIKIVEETTSS